MRQSLICLYIICGFLNYSCDRIGLRSLVTLEYERKQLRKATDNIFVYHDGQYLGILAFDSSTSEHVVFGRLIGDIYGHHFRFRNDSLTTYKFQFENKGFSYGLVRGEQNNFSEQGSPMVDFWQDKTIKTKDSSTYVFYFSKFPRSELAVYYSLDSVRFQTLAIKESPIMPFLAEGRLTISNQFEGINFRIQAKTLWSEINALQDEKTFELREQLN
jgi:hypothetical protein